MSAEIFAVLAATAILLLAVSSPLANPFFVWKKRKLPACPIPTSTLSPVSVLVIPNRNAEALREHLPVILRQEYAGDMQVVVVTEKGDTETEDALTAFETDSRLYVTYIPESSRYISRKKLAITLGVKAAKHEWIVLIDAESCPETSQWLSAISRNFTPDKNLVLSYCHTPGATSFQRFCQLRLVCQLMRQAVPWRAIGGCLAFRKSLFLDRHGYRQNLQFVGGEYDFLVSLFASKDSTTIEMSPEAYVKEDAPTKRRWRNSQLQYLSIRGHLKKTVLARMRFNLENALMFLTDIAMLAGLLAPLASIPSDAPTPAAFHLSSLISNTTGQWIVFGTALLSIFVNTFLRIRFAKKAAERRNERLPLPMIPFYERVLPLHHLLRLYQYRRSDKTDYSTHKV
ncbi:MAG: glycosyltransferase [Prevotella sp.]|nr:glycosyltransferase [Prevotella sp.]